MCFFGYFIIILVEEGIEYLKLELFIISWIYIITLLIREGQKDFKDYIFKFVGREKGRNTEP